MKIEILNLLEKGLSIKLNSIYRELYKKLRYLLSNIL